MSFFARALLACRPSSLLFLAASRPSSLGQRRPWSAALAADFAAALRRGFAAVVVAVAAAFFLVVSCLVACAWSWAPTNSSAAAATREIRFMELPPEVGFVIREQLVLVDRGRVVVSSDRFLNPRSGIWPKRPWHSGGASHASTSSRSASPARRSADLDRDQRGRRAQTTSAARPKPTHHAQRSRPACRTPAADR